MENKYYDVLGLEENADERQIKVAYREKARMFHPDLNKDPGSEELFKIVQEAYEILSDVQKRKEYDKTLVHNKKRAEPQKASNQREPGLPKEQYTEEINGLYEEEVDSQPTVKTRLSKRWIANRLLLFLTLVVIPAIVWVSFRNVFSILIYLSLIYIIDNNFYELRAVANIGVSIWLIVSIIDVNIKYIILSITLFLLINGIAYILGWELNIFK